MQNLHTTIGLLFSLKNSMCLEEQCPEEQTTFWLPKILVFGTTRAAASLCLCSQQTQVHRLDSSQYGVNHCYASQEKVIKEVINVYILPRERRRLSALRRALAVRVFLRRFHLIYRPPGPLDWTPPSGRGSRLDRRGRQHGFGRGKSEEAYSRLGYSRIISGTARRQKCVSHLS